MVRHHYSHKPGGGPGGVGYRRPHVAGPGPRSQATALPASGPGTSPESIQRRLNNWDAGVAEFDEELRANRRVPHPFRALKGCDLCLDCGATADELIMVRYKHTRVKLPIHREA